MKKIILLLVLFINLQMIGQEKFKVSINKKKFTTSFIYSIDSKTKSDFKIQIIRISDKKILKEIFKKSILGLKDFKIDLSDLDKGEYDFLVTNDNYKSNYKQKITKE